MGLGGAWNSDGVIIFTRQIAGPLYRVAADGGTPTPVTPIPEEQSSQLHCWPVFLPQNDRFLFFVNRTGPRDLLRNGIYAGSLTSGDAQLISSHIDGNVGFSGDHMFFVAEGGLKAQPFDSERLQLTGQVVPILQHELTIWDPVWFHQGFSVSESGTVIFQSRSDFASELVWADASGTEYGQIRGGYWAPAISPDGRRLAVSSDAFHDGKWYVCVHDIEREVTARLTDGGREWFASWSPTGDKIIYDSIAGHTSFTYAASADGSGLPQLLLEPGSIGAHESRDGSVAFAQLEGGWPQLAVLFPANDAPSLVGPGVEPQFSPDGRWVSYTEPGSAGISVRPFPALQPGIKISAGPAAQPKWSRDGTQLFFITGDRKLMAVTFNPQSGRSGAPRQLFQTRIVRASMAGFQFDVAPNGRFLINSLPPGSPPLSILVACNSLLR